MDEMDYMDEMDKCPFKNQVQPGVHYVHIVHFVHLPPPSNRA
jgi:hypothetical protein